jgi:hypothetical protein
MNYTSLSARAKLLIISGSLLVHLLLLLLLFIAITGENPFDSSRHLDALATILAQSPQETEDATVIFYDEPAQQAMGSTMSSEPMSAQTDAPFDAYAKKEEVTVQEKTAAESIPETAHDSEQATKLLAAAELPETLHIANDRDTRTPPATQQQKPGTAGASGIGNITLAEIAKGFLKSMAQESGGKPTSLNAEELARQRYGTRVWSLLRQSYNAYKSPTQLLNDIHTHAVLVLNIDKTGKIISAELQHPKKTLDIIQIERSLLQAVYKAGLFPPIPKQFDVDTITLSYPLGIRGHEGTHMYDLIYE